MQVEPPLSMPEPYRFLVFVGLEAQGRGATHIHHCIWPVETFSHGSSFEIDVTSRPEDDGIL